MNPKKMLQGLTFVGEVTAKRQTYYVYESDKEYIMMTVSRQKDNSFNFSIVPKEATAYVIKTFSGRTVTSSEVLNQSRRPAYIKGTFDALNILYALCATGVSKIDQRFKKGPALHFTLKRR